jgi:hypothetical protein
MCFGVNQCSDLEHPYIKRNGGNNQMKNRVWADEDTTFDSASQEKIPPPFRRMLQKNNSL